MSSHRNSVKSTKKYQLSCENCKGAGQVLGLDMDEVWLAVPIGLIKV
jgi:hypothetical protein